MPEFLQTNKVGRGKASHRHIAYTREDGQGVTSKDKDHTHDIIFNAPQEAVTDPTTAIELVPAITGGFEVLPGGKDNHTHTLQDVDGTEKNKQQTNSDKVKDVLSLYKEAKELEKSPRKKGNESEAFYDGTGQWDSEKKGKMESSNRAALTINEIESKIDLLSGYQRQNRFDIRYFPTEDGDAKVADILNIVVKNILEQSNFEYVETDVFEDETIVGRGLFNNYIDYDSNIKGDIVIEQFPWDQCYFGPHVKKDLSDCEYLIKVKWQSAAKLKQLWPDKAGDVGKELDIPDEDEVGTVKPGRQYTGTEESLPLMVNDADLVNIQRKEYKTMECWRKEYLRVPVLVNIEDNFYFNAEEWSTGDVSSVKSIPGFSIVYKKVHRMRVTTISAKTFLDDDYPDLASDEFEIIPVYAKKRRDNWWGKVEAAKDPQKEINKRHSQVVDILNKVASYGWFYDSETFRDKQGATNFKKNASSPGFTQEISDVKRPPVPVEGVKFPSEIVNMQSVATQKLREIMNVNPEMLGINSNAESGIAIAEKKQAGMTGNEYLYDNLSFAKKLLGKQLVSKVQKVYDTDRLLRVVQGRMSREKIEVGGLPLVEPGQPVQDEQGAQVAYSIDDLRAVLEEADLTKYDVAVGESSFNPTTRRANFLEWLDAAGKGIPVPPGLLVDLSDLSDKDRVKKEIEAMQQAQAQAEQAKIDAEIQKVLLAQRGQPGVPS